MSTATTAASRVSRTVIQSVLAREQSEGVGAVVRRSIGTPQLKNFTPFLMLDNFKVSEGAGFPDHGHRGMSTVTYLLEGEFEHEDFVGHRGRLGPGDLQFMIAGKGIMHAEMPVHTKGGKDPSGLQLWIDLPKDQKLVEPSYQELKKEEIPSANPTPAIEIKVICGESRGSATQGVVKSPVRPLGGCWFFDVVWNGTSGGDENEMEVFQEIPKGWNAFIYTLSGTILAADSTLIGPFHTSILSAVAGQEGIRLKATSGQARAVIIAGEPLDQEIVQHGPFVMDTVQGIREAFMDYSAGKNGFEGAHEWRSEIGRKMT